MKKTKIFFINGIILTITAFVMKSISMIFNLYVSNYIGSEAVGTFSLVMSVYLFAITIATSGLSLACTCIVSEEFAKGNYLNGIKAVRSCLFFSLLFSLGSSLFVFLFSDIISQNWLNSSVSPFPLYLICMGLPFISISSVMNGYFSAVRKAYKSAFSQIFELFVKIFITILLLKFLPHKTVESICILLLLADIISEICSCTLLVILYQMDKLKYSKRSISIITFKKKILKIMLPVSITSCIRSGLATLKQFLIPSRLLLFGLPYSIALSEYGKINGMTMSVLLFPSVFISSFSNLLVPEFTSLMAKQYKKRILEICKKVFFTTSIFSIGICLIFFSFANEISLMIFQNLSCSHYIKILSPLVLFMYGDTILDNMLKGFYKQFSVMICNIFDLILTISILYFLLPKWGIIGYLLSIMISELFNFSVSYFQLYRITGFKIKISMFFIYLFLFLLGVFEMIEIL